MNKKDVRNHDCEKNEIAKHCWEADHNINWDRKKVVDRESRFIKEIFLARSKKPYIL